MSTQATNLVFRLALPPKAKFVLLALADCADENGERIFPAVPTVARKVNMGERTVYRLLKELKARDVLIPVRYQGGGRGHPTEYRIPLEKLCQQVAGFAAPVGSESLPRRTRNPASKDNKVCHQVADDPSVSVRIHPERRGPRTARRGPDPELPGAERTRTGEDASELEAIGGTLGETLRRFAGHGRRS